MPEFCPHCQIGKLKAAQTVFVQRYGDTLVHAPHTPAWKCDVCGLTVFDSERIRHIEVVVGTAGPPPNRHRPGPVQLPLPADRPDDAPVEAEAPAPRKLRTRH